MWRLSPLLLLIALAAVPAAEPVPPSHAAAVVLAWADARRIDPPTAQRVRYFYLVGGTPAELDEQFAVLSLQINLVSRGPNVRRPVRLTPWLVRADLGDYKIDPVVFAAARVKDAYFHTPVKDAKGVVSFAAPAYLPQKELAALGDRLGSPSLSVIYRADWWVVAAGIEEDRGDYGYYSLLGLKSGADVDRLAGHDQAAAEREFAETAAVIRRSGVSIFSRQVFRYGTRRGAYWETRDPDKATGDSAALSRLFKDFTFAGKEVVFTLPNGMPGFALENAKDELVKSGPPNLVGDKRPDWNGRDARVHVGAGCVTCHLGGALRPLNDYFRHVARQGRGVGVGSPDKDLSERIQRVYLGPLQEVYERDAGEFGRAYFQAAGVPASKVPTLYARVWNRYVGDLSVERMALELDTTPDRLRKAVGWKMTKAPLDPALGGLVGPADDADPVRREVFEEAYPLLRAILAEYPG